MKMPWTLDSTDAGLDDDTIVEQGRTNPAAFADLYERYRPDIYGFILRRVGDPHRAEDVTSQIFLHALRGLPTYRSGSFRGCLYQIARNTISDSYRRECPTSSDDELLDAADAGPGPVELTEVREAKDRLHRILDRLSDNQRDIIRLRLRGYTGQEIADKLRMGLAAVKSSQFRAFANIRTLMDETQPEHPEPDHSRFRRPDR